MNKMQKIWKNEKLISWDSAQPHVLTHSLHYGSAVFEGIRCYKTAKGGAVFKLREQQKKLRNNIIRLFTEWCQNLMPH